MKLRVAKKVLANIWGTNVTTRAARRRRERRLKCLDTGGGYVWLTACKAQDVAAKLVAEAALAKAGL